jgi:hypothetical protein
MADASRNGLWNTLADCRGTNREKPGVVCPCPPDLPAALRSDSFGEVMQVKIVLRDRHTGLYYRGENSWVGNGYEALTFGNILDAESYCRRHGLTDLQFIQQSGYFARGARMGRSTGSLLPSDSTLVSN